MKRSALALGASVLAFALTTGSAAADPGQTVADSTGAAQVGAVSVDAPLRVLSDGNGTTTGANAGGPQTTSDSTGAAQVTSVDANAPVRVLSDGDDANTGASAGGDQSTSDSTGSAQVGAVGVNTPLRVLGDRDNETAGSTASGVQSTEGSVASAQAGSPPVDAPVRVLSDGDNTTAGTGAGGKQTVGDSTGSVQLGSPALSASIQVASDETALGGAEDPGGVVAEIVGALLGESPASPASQAPEESAGRADGSPTADELRRLRDGSDPGVRFISDVPGTAAPSDAQVLGVSAASRLPYTGLGLVAIAVIGAWLLASGLALRLVPGGQRR